MYNNVAVSNNIKYKAMLPYTYLNVTPTGLQYLSKKLDNASVYCTSISALKSHLFHKEMSLKEPIVILS